MRFWVLSVVCSRKSRVFVVFRCCSRGGFFWVRKEVKVISSWRMVGREFGKFRVFSCICFFVI